MCVWAGTVRVRVTLSSAGTTQEVTLTFAEPIVFANKKVTLTDVSPAQHSNKSITPSEYRFTFSVTQ